MADKQEIRDALDHISPQEREVWFRMGGALKTELGADGFEIWDTWASRDSEGYKENVSKATWKSMKPGRVHIESLFYEARRSGWVPGKPFTPPSPQEKAAQAEQRRLADHKAIEQRAQEAAEARARAQARWDNAKPANPKHPYLVAKGITSPTVIGALRQDGNQLLVPLRQNKEITMLQAIGPNGFKSFDKGGELVGSAFLIGHPRQATSERGVLVAEGFATAASLHQATGQPVLAAFTAYNLKNVAESLKDRMPDIPVTFCADNDPNGVGIRYAEESAEMMGHRAQAIMPEFTDRDFAGYRQKHGPEAVPSDFNDLAQIRGLEAVKTVVEQYQVPREAVQEQAPDAQEPAVTSAPASVFGAQEQNRIEPALEQHIVQEVLTQAAAGPRQDAEPVSAESRESEAFRAPEPPEAQEAPELGVKKPILDLAYKAPPDGLEVRYLYVDGRYVDAGNGVTTIFQDKGKYLATTKQDIQTVHDMVEVAKAKGWDKLKLSGTPEFKRLMYIEAESQGIKTRGYQPTPADLAMVTKRQEERSLNQVQPDLSQEKTKERGQEPEVKPGQQKEARAVAAADRLVAQNELPTEAQFETSPKADIDSDVRMRDIGSQSIPSEVKIAADQMRVSETADKGVAVRPGFLSRLNPASQAKFRYMQHLAAQVVGYMRHDRREDAHRNFNTNMEKAVQGTALNVPEPMKERAAQVSQPTVAPEQKQGRQREQQPEMTLEP